MGRIDFHDCHSCSVDVDVYYVVMITWDGHQQVTATVVLLRCGAVVDFDDVIVVWKEEI